jgi:hypothetical protein
MASSSLGLVEQVKNPWILTDLALAGQEEHCSTRTLSHNDNSLHLNLLYYIKHSNGRYSD